MHTYRMQKGTRKEVQRFLGVRINVCSNNSESTVSFLMSKSMRSLNTANVLFLHHTYWL